MLYTRLEVKGYCTSRPQIYLFMRVSDRWSMKMLHRLVIWLMASPVASLPSMKVIHGLTICVMYLPIASIYSMICELTPSYARRKCMRVFVSGMRVPVLSYLQKKNPYCVALSTPLCEQAKKYLYRQSVETLLASLHGRENRREVQQRHLLLLPTHVGIRLSLIRFYNVCV